MVLCMRNTGDVRCDQSGRTAGLQAVAASHGGTLARPYPSPPCPNQALIQHLHAVLARTLVH